MLAGQRQKLILDEARRLGAVRVKELTHLLAVSLMTVRRDLETLAESGLSREGARRRDCPRSPQRRGARVRDELPSAAGREGGDRRSRPPSRRAGTGDRADGRDDDAWHFAQRIAHVPNLTIVTNSIQVADVLQRERRPDVTVVLTGGVRTPSEALVGPVAVTTISTLHLDLLFLGVHGMAENAGLAPPTCSRQGPGLHSRGAAGRRARGQHEVGCTWLEPRRTSRRGTRPRDGQQPVRGGEGDARSPCRAGRPGSGPRAQST